MTQNNVGIYASQISGHLYGGPYGAYDSLATVTLSAATSSITFAGIPSGYKHLQIRWFGLITTGGPSNIYVNFNGDNAANYAVHQLYGDGASAGATSGVSASNANLGIINSTVSSGIIDVLDYASTNKNKTGRAIGGYDNNGSGYVVLRSSLWMSTSAINSIVIAPSSSTFTANSSFALYGVK